MKNIKRHLFHSKIHQIAGCSPHFWLKNALFSNPPKLRGFWRYPVYFCITGNFTRIALLTVLSVIFLITNVYANNVNLAFGKFATQSSTYPHYTDPLASKAVDGNTSGYFWDASTTHTKKQQGAWWQVDLEEIQTIGQIIIYNRTDCCKGRLNNYKVIVSTEENFNAITYEQKFRSIPNPKIVIDLGVNGKQGRFVKIQLLGNNYLSLAEVQIIATENSCNIKKKIRSFSEIDVSSMFNDFSGLQNAPLFPNFYAFAAINDDGTITAWGDASSGGSNAPSDNDYIKIYSNIKAFAALKYDGSIIAWGDVDYGGSDAPIDNGYIKIYSNENTFVAIKNNGSITAWGNDDYGKVSDAPTGKGYLKVYSNSYAFAAIKNDGSITVWGKSYFGGLNAPTDSGYINIYSTDGAFAALKSDGSISVWGSGIIDKHLPTDSGYIKIYSNHVAFVALHIDGSIKVFTGSWAGFHENSTNNNYIKIYSTEFAFAALKTDGSIKVWGETSYGGGADAPTDSGYIDIYSTGGAFAAIKPDGSIKAWGCSVCGGLHAPKDNGYIKIYSTGSAFAAIKLDGTISSWGGLNHKGANAPDDKGYIDIYSTIDDFIAIKPDGSTKTW
ncbi:hypothetical protein MS2017_1162 [Bathymodiolus thermophilus thioautotrophic gill symbiont]|uniref:Fucolectin tachylectin-4 pentraxin-1 domain-containing protein n=1 Tax=Bathymodiolus thermophilus thioautotrophic gill symbiont TaxID=2360 RepID=A0A3G3IMZ6_9GAMM|nr:hypothetical protein MS2017_1162 [Bathymodiolus thermophilus thioautotrophic gill symbiont]